MYASSAAAPTAASSSMGAESAPPLDSSPSPKKKRDPRAPFISISPSAQARIIELLQENPEAKGLRIGVTKGGCSGMEYVIDLTSEQRPHDIVVTLGGATVFVDAGAQLYVALSELDFEVNGEVSKEFKFRNPNAKESCGCGISFSM